MSITLQAVTADNWRQLIALEVAPHQTEWVAPNHISLLESSYGLGGDLSHLVLVPLGIYADARPVGLLLYNAAPAFDRFVVMRLMIDRGAQGRGHGRAAITQLLGLLRAFPQAKEVAISYNTGNTAAERLYRSCGFIEIGPDDAGGILMWQALNPQAAPWTSLWNPSIAAGDTPAL